MTLNQQTRGASEVDGLYLSEIRPGEALLVRTRNSLYTIVYLGFGAAEVSGPRGVFREGEPVNILGSTWGGSALLSGFIGIGMCLEFQTPGERAVMTTTPVQEIVRLGTGDQLDRSESEPIAPAPEIKRKCAPRDVGEN